MSSAPPSWLIADKICRATCEMYAPDQNQSIAANYLRRRISNLFPVPEVEPRVSTCRDEVEVSSYYPGRLVCLWKVILG